MIDLQVYLTYDLNRDSQTWVLSTFEAHTDYTHGFTVTSVLPVTLAPKKIQIG